MEDRTKHAGNGRRARGGALFTFVAIVTTVLAALMLMHQAGLV
ncbi:hypothetical protein [Acuticoccus sp.]